MVPLRRQAWQRLAGRHLEMARALHESYPDGAFFHVYRAFECIVCSELLRLAPGESIPEGHRDKVVEFMDLAGKGQVAQGVAKLWPHIDHRNEALYLGWRKGAVREPTDVFNTARVQPLVADVAALLDQVRGG